MAVPRSKCNVVRWALALAALAHGMAGAQPTRLTLATGAEPPLTAAAGRPGFLDELAAALFSRLGVEVTLVRMPVARALINADAGIEDGDMFRTPGFEAGFPNLIQVPEKLIDMEFLAYTLRPEISVRQWSDLAPLHVGLVTGTKLLERRTQGVVESTGVREPGQLIDLLRSGKIDVALLTRWQGDRLGREAGLALIAQEPPLATVPAFIYLHRKHAALVLPTAVALAGLKHDGTWQRLFDQAMSARKAVQ